MGIELKKGRVFELGSYQYGGCPGEERMNISSGKKKSNLDPTNMAVVQERKCEKGDGDESLKRILNQVLPIWRLSGKDKRWKFHTNMAVVQEKTFEKRNKVVKVKNMAVV